MMNKMNKTVWMAVMIAATTALTGWAVDYGVPLYTDNVESAVRVEALYNHYDRDIRVGSVDDSTDEDLYMLRLDIANEFTGLYLDAGVLDDDRKDGGTPAVVGAGIRVSSYENEIMRISLLVDGHYIPEYDTKTDSGFKGDFKYYEVGAGLIFSAKIAGDMDVWQVIPYAGLAYSIIRGDYKVKVDGNSDLNYDIKEKDEIVGVMGVAFIWNEKYTARIEADLLSDSSYSAALGIAF